MSSAKKSQSSRGFLGSFIHFTLFSCGRFELNEGKLPSPLSFIMQVVQCLVSAVSRLCVSVYSSFNGAVSSSACVVP